MKLKRKAVSYFLAKIGQSRGRWLPSTFKKLGHIKNQIEFKNNNQVNFNFDGNARPSRGRGLPSCFDGGYYS